MQRQVAEVLAFAGAMAHRTGLGFSEMAALEHLQRASGSEEGGLTPTQLGRLLSLSSGAVTALVDRLEGAGRAERVPNPRDRRSWVVRVRLEGLAGPRRHMVALRDDLLEVTAELSEEERAAVGRYLEDVAEVFARHARG